MKKIFSLFALLFALVFAFNGVVFGWGSSGGDASDYGQLQETAVFFNNSGAKLVHGQAIVLDLDSTASSTAPIKIAPTAGTTLGTCVETLTASADSNLVIGVVKVASENQTPVIVVTRGPIDTITADASDGVSAGSAVGTAGSGEAGSVGVGSGLGVALEAGAGTDGDYIYTWVQPGTNS